MYQCFGSGSTFWGKEVKLSRQNPNKNCFKILIISLLFLISLFCYKIWERFVENFVRVDFFTLLMRTWIRIHIIMFASTNCNQTANSGLFQTGSQHHFSSCNRLWAAILLELTSKTRLFCRQSKKLNKKSFEETILWQGFENINGSTRPFLSTGIQNNLCRPISIS